MSDFASLLSNLKTTARKRRFESPNAVVMSVETTSHYGDDSRAGNNNHETASTSRKRRNLKEVSRRDHGQRPNNDIKDLKISLSFLCIGAQKAGTTWLDEMLRKIATTVTTTMTTTHNVQLALPTHQKELHFWDWHRSKGLGWYSRQWNVNVITKSDNSPSSTSSPPPPPPPPRLLYGEVTPCYAILPDQAIREIRSLFPKVRIVFLARDLVDRAWSALLMELRNSTLGLSPGQFVGFDRQTGGSCDDDNKDSTNNNNNKNNNNSRMLQQQQLERESDPDRYGDEFFMNRLRHSTHQSRSDYASSLRRWLLHFPKEQVLILRYQDVVENPRRLLCQCLEHVMGVPSAKSWVDALDDEHDLKQRINVGAIAKPPRPSLRIKMEQFLQPYARDFNVLLQELGYDWALNEYNVVHNSTA